MTHISIRDLQKMSSDKIAALPGPTPVKSGNETVAILLPVMSRPDPDRLRQLGEELRALSAAHRSAQSERERADEEALLRSWGVDLTDYGALPENSGQPGT